MVTSEHIGERVTDGERVGILKAIDPEWEDPGTPPPRKEIARAWVRPEKGGIEWMISPANLNPV
ncbi:hypothetical protein ACFQ7F_13125 [Streptomyces sp. NPDC056486]|uniref:hypothetical protein n=1 Tax=Streptomyces sp. NPDC056486 TaxID=3345835 RepID=UPI0036C07751